MRILSVGEVVWDVFPDEAEHLGGAPLNLAVHSAQLGHEVAMVTAVGDDRRGRLALERIARSGIDTRFIGKIAKAPTGVVRVGVNGNGLPAYRLERPAAYDFATLPHPDIEAVAGWRPAWICYGTLFHQAPGVLEMTERLFSACPEASRLYDVNLRPGQQSPELVVRLASQAHILKLSEEEAPAVASLTGESYEGRERFMRRMSARFRHRVVCMTRGAEGCAILSGSAYLECVGEAVRVVDTVGAGDAFAAAFLHGLHAGWPPSETGLFANRVGALVASRPGATPQWSLEDITLS